MMNRIGNGEWVSDGMTATTSHLRTITLSLVQPSFQSRETRSTRVERVFRSFFSWYRARQFGLPACAIASGETSGSERSQQPLGGKQAEGEKSEKSWARNALDARLLAISASLAFAVLRKLVKQNNALGTNAFCVFRTCLGGSARRIVDCD
jgi:hypothetical protein